MKKIAAADLPQNAQWDKVAPAKCIAGIDITDECKLTPLPGVSLKIHFFQKADGIWPVVEATYAGKVTIIEVGHISKFAEIFIQPHFGTLRDIAYLFNISWTEIVRQLLIHAPQPDHAVALLYAKELLTKVGTVHDLGFLLQLHIMGVHVDELLSQDSPT